MGAWRTPASAHVSAGFGLKSISPLGYLSTQPGVLLHYLRLVVWPHPLVFDYAWQPTPVSAALMMPGLMIGGLLGFAVWLIHRQPSAGFLAAGFFLFLAPTSSVFPLMDLAAEHRMYLPLAVVITGLVFLIEAALVGWLVPGAAAIARAGAD